MTTDMVLLLLGLVFLLGGGETLVRGASAIARATGVPPLVIGLTVVAFGTSAPELAVNVFAAWRDSGNISFGNIYGSNMANIGLILGLAGLIRPLSIRSVVISREIPMMLVATIAGFIMASDAFFGGGADEYNRIDGVMLLLLFSVFLYYTVGDMTRQRDPASTVFESNDSDSSDSMTRNILLTLGGLGALLAGAELTVDGAMGIARAMGISEVIIGLTLVALGTSLPELVTAVIATMRGHIDLAVGNVVGSNIFNILLVMGATSVIRPVAVPALGHIDLSVTLALSLALWWVATTRNRRIVRVEASGLLVVYISYICWRTLY